MAKLDDLIAQVGDAKLRTQLEEATTELRRRKKFGLVFEQHIPETTVLPDATVRKGSVVMIRTEPANRTRFVVDSIGKKEATISAGDEAWTIAVDDILVVKPFGEPVYPVLRPVGEPVVRSSDKPFQAVINGENFHALQLLLFGYEAQVDCIYIDPPYNTGARDWKYNNNFVDRQDSWRHSKWLSFMDKRLRLAQRLLKPDGVLIVTIDEHEVNHLGVLLEQRFPRHLRYMVTSVINPKGTYKANFGRVDEQLFFVVPDTGSDVILPRPRSAEDAPDGIESEDEDLIRAIVASSDVDPETVVDAPQLSIDQRERLRVILGLDDVDDEAEEGELLPETADYEYWFLRRRGQESSYRTQRPNQFYAIYVNEETRQVIGIGPLLAVADKWSNTRDGDVASVYPIDNEGHERVWRYSRDTMQGYIDNGEIVVGRYNPTTESWTLNHRKLKKDVLRHKTVWWYKSHDAGVHGTNVVNRLLGTRNLFPFPKSIYAVRDTLSAVVRDRPDAVILDFFAGSGTTLQATCMLNAEDGGRRRCILVTNNEVDEKLATSLNKEGLYRGDPEFESHGIFEQVTRPRCEASITGTRPDGSPVPGKYVGGRPFSEGFEENVLSFDVRYADPDAIDVGASFESILPALWFAAGCYDDPTVIKYDDRWLIAPDSRFAVLLDEDRFREFRSLLTDHPQITHVWLVTDSEAAFARMRDGIGAEHRVGMLYRDYLRNFQVNIDSSLAAGDLP
jgi:adenine-specific DNA-methyltransferase